MGFPNPRRVTPPLAVLTGGSRQEFLIPVSDTQAYRQFGNSVVVDVIEHLAWSLVDQANLVRLGVVNAAT